MAAADCEYCGGTGQAPYGPALDLEPCAGCTHENVGTTWTRDHEYYIGCLNCGVPA